jgi:menaquinone-9 beta-reductase
MKPDFDVIIVGGGPVGLSAGIQLARQNIRTLILEKEKFPIDKACGEGIMPTGKKILDRLGIIENLDLRQCSLFRGIRYYSMAGKLAQANFIEGEGLGIRRVELSRVLCDFAQNTPHLELLPQSKVTGIENAYSQAFVHVKHQKISTSLIVAADGLRSTVRSLANLNGRSSHLKRFGASEHYQIKPWSDYVEVHYQPGIEAYVTPCGGEQIDLTFLWNQTSYTPSLKGRNLVNGFLKQFPLLQERLQYAKPIGKIQAIGPMLHRASSPVANQVALIGDAASYLDPITGEGISLGLLSASLLIQTTLPFFLLQQKNNAGIYFSRKILRPFAQLLKKRTRNYYLTTHFALMLARYPELAEKIIADFQGDPDFFAHLLSVNMGNAHLFGKDPHKMIRYAFWFMKIAAKNTFRQELASKKSPELKPSKTKNLFD